MEAAGELAGFFAAHAVWCVSDGEVLIPLVGYETLEGQRLMQRMTAERIEDGVAEGKAWMAANPELAARAVLIFDAFVTLESGRTDALIVLLRDYTQAAAQVTIAEVEELVEPGEIDPDAVHLPGIFVQRVIALTPGQAADKKIEQRTVSAPAARGTVSR